MSIFDQIGGPTAVTAAVDDFYRRVLADSALAPYFDAVDLERLKGHQRAFIAAAIGGPDPYLGRSMREAHAPFAIAPEHFDLVVTHLVDTLAGLGVDGPTIEAIGAELAPLKAEIAPGASARAS
ncbi:group I truncated hemoglobin [Mycolicibacterium psychrotolerans]|uniref:Group 1 truncated hemoglobin n=1 Tax=Mycolicibacterium psychrotolerans TaxID=216929 RepID=A0A7I7MDD8_9MYCO|nr:group 1 truncated hemoglobin [Mycolicibacterium psychrotolerans]BBX70036.1 hemin receptor [Mycolicibacterium psychrotolerans]